MIKDEQWSGQQDGTHGKASRRTRNVGATSRQFPNSHAPRLRLHVWLPLTKSHAGSQQD